MQFEDGEEGVISLVVLSYPSPVQNLVLLYIHSKYFQLRGMLYSISLNFKVARPSIFIGTPSIFESLILKQIDLYCKTIMTHGLHLD